MTRADVAIGGVLTVVFVMLAWQATQLTYGTEFAPGPAFAPLWLGVLGAALALVTAVRARTAPAAPPLDFRAEGRVALAVLGVVVAVIVVPLIGFVTAFAVYLVFFSVLVVRLRPPVALATSLAVTLFIYLVFARLLAVPFPVGPLGF